MSIEAQIERLVTAVEANTQVLQILNAGREASLAQLEKARTDGETAPKATRTRKKADEPVAAETPVTTPAATTAAAAVGGLSAIETSLKAAVTSHIEGGTTDDEKKARVADIAAIMQHFGGKLIGPQSTLDDDQKAQAQFYVNRYAAGCTVDFSQDYDFAGDPTQGGLDAAEPAAGDDFDIG